MSISSKNKQKKLKENGYSSIIGTYKIRVDRGEKLEDLDFRIFEDKADEMFHFMKKYIEINYPDKKKGIDFL